MTVPEVLLNGNHEEIRRWRREQGLKKTLRNRPDLLEGAQLSKEDKRIVDGVSQRRTPTANANDSRLKD